jgi:hypothetical protein
LASTASGFKETAPVRGWLAPGPFPLLGRLIKTQLSGCREKQASAMRHRCTAWTPCVLICQHRWAKLRVIHVTVQPHAWCSFAGTCSFGFPSKAVRLTLRVTGAGYIHKQSIFPGPPQRQCCGILCELAAIYRVLPIPALPRIDRPWLHQVRDPASWLA